MGECCQAVAQGGEAFDRACHAARENGSALVRGRPMPVGSGRFRDRTQVPRGVLGMTFSSSLALNQEGCVAKTHRNHAGSEVALLAQHGCHWKQARLVSYLKRNLFRLRIYFHFLPFEQRTAQVASTGVLYYVPGRWVKVPAKGLTWSLTLGREGLSGLPHHQKPARSRFGRPGRFIHHVQCEHQEEFLEGSRVHTAQ